MSTDPGHVRYQRRHRWPILVFIVVLLVAGGIIWFQILRPGPAAATGCNQPGPAPASPTATTRRSLTSASGSTRPTSTTGTSKPATSKAGPAGGTKSTKAGGTGAAAARSTAAANTARSSKAATVRSTARPATTGSTGATSITTTLGQFVAKGTLAATRPADPSTITLQVFNASGTRGLARTVTQDLQQSGFASINDATNDVLYPAADLTCQAEIRFGQAGLSQARTVLIVAPCAQLVLDNRIDESVDLALGATFDYAPVTETMKAQLKALHDAAAPPAVIEGQTAAPRPLASIPPLPAVNCSVVKVTTSP